MERLEIHSKSFLIKWVNAQDESIINWQVKPDKKSINVGLFRKVADFSLAGGDVEDKKNHSITDNIEERLQQNGLERVVWHGKCNAAEFVRGEYNVEEQGGIYALVFDNTFSKNTAKTVLFSQQVVPKKDKRTRANSSASQLAQSEAPVEESTVISDGRYITGILLKKRRKRLQGYGRRYFSLDYKYGLLNYYLDQKSSLLRGSMPIQHCVISAKEQSREIFIDSGMEVWSLRALSLPDFKTWVQALDVARNPNDTDAAVVTAASRAGTPIRNSLVFEDTDWKKVEKLYTRLDEITNRAQQNGSSPSLRQNEFSVSQTSLNEIPPPTPEIPEEHKSEVKTIQRRPSFWRRKNSRRSSAGNQQPNHSNQSTDSLNANGESEYRALVSELSEIVADFKKIFDGREKNALRASAIRTPPPRKSMDGGESIWSEDLFYDAHEKFDNQGVLYVNEEESSDQDREVHEDDDGGISSDEEEDEARLRKDISTHHPIEKHDLAPLPSIAGPIKRRTTILEQKSAPPSLIGVLKKNVGKDLANIAMPITMNEPISMLQRLGESVEHTSLIDQAVKSDNPVERAMFIALFGVTFLSGFKAKCRCIRKSFNPLLGETYELVREDKGYRFVAEKVSHRPVGFALHCESSDWTIQYSGYPRQKFWGKSAEITDSGPYRITLNETGETFEFLQPSIFLRNIIAGEKYTEPVGSLTVYSSTGAKGMVTFKAGGMFSGRSEEITINGYDENGSESPIVIQGTWTNEVSFVKGPRKGEVIWKCGNLVKDYEKKYGFTEFAASLNEITPIEAGHLPPTDSRLRPDQRMYENGDVDKSEQKKLDLEEWQRKVRHEREAKNETYKPFFFEPSASDNEFYTLKRGPQNYWEMRKTGTWDNVPKLFDN